jgi:hypothetical protein
MNNNEQNVRKDTSHRVRKKFINISRGSIAFVLIAVMILGIVVVPKLRSIAAFDPSTAIKYKDYRAKNEIEDYTLFIGTYLIALPALTDDLYTEASDSATESKQTTIYYFSELADGAWRNVTDATSLFDLGPESGVAATEEELAELYITKVIGADGVVKDAKTGDIVDPFGDPDPYDLFHLPELVAIRKAYAGAEDAEEPSLGQFLIDHGQTEIPGTAGLTPTTYSKGDDAARSVEADTFAYNAFHDFFASDVHNEVTDECDRRLAVLTELHNQLKAENDAKRADAVYSLMGKVDATRRAEVFRQLSMDPEYYMRPLSEKLTEGLGYEGATFVTNVAETDAISSAEETIMSAYYEKLGNALVEDSSSIIGRYEFEYSVQVIENGSRDAIDELIILWNIRDDIIEDQAKELQKIEDDYLPEAESEYRTRICAGVSSDYMAIYRKSGAMAAASYLESQRDEMEHARTEIQLFIDAQRKRMTPADALDFIFDRIDWTTDLYDRIPDDNANENATKVNDLHILWLRDVIEQILAENESLRSKLQQLTDEMNGLETDRQVALDNNDLAGAKLLESQINAIKQQINDETAKLNAIINSANASDKDKEMAKASLGAGEDKLINSLSDAALGAIADNNTDNLSAAANGLAGLGATDALGKLQDRLNKNAGKNTGANKTTADAMKSILDKAESDANANKNKSGFDPNNLDDLLAALKSIFGDPITGEDLAGAIAGLSMLGNEGNSVAANLAATLARSLTSGGAGAGAGVSGINTGGSTGGGAAAYLYDQYESDRANEYISLKTIGDVTEYRYVYFTYIDETTMAGKGCALSFRTNSDIVRNANNERRSLSAKTVKQKYHYIREKDAILYFSCEEEPVPLTKIAVCMTPPVKEKALELVNYIKSMTQ